MLRNSKGSASPGTVNPGSRRVFSLNGARGKPCKFGCEWEFLERSLDVAPGEESGELGAGITGEIYLFVDCYK